MTKRMPRPHDAMYYTAMHEGTSMGTTSVRMPDELLARLEKVSTQVRRTKGWIINDAVREYVERQELQARRHEKTREALADMQAGRVMDGEAVMQWLESWGTPEEGAPPA